MLPIIIAIMVEVKSSQYTGRVSQCLCRHSISTCWSHIASTSDDADDAF